MANKQTLPNMVDTKKTFVQGQSSPKLPSFDYRSGMRDIAGAMEQTNDFLNEYQKMKFEQFQAGLQNIELQQIHEMQDATDPCQLEEINKKYEKAYASQYKNDFWGDSYYQSRYYENWKARHTENQQKVYFQKQHDFSAIQATATLNELSNTIALTNSPEEVYSLLRNGEAMLANSKHLTAQDKFKLMSDFYKQSVGNLYSSNPNKAVAWLNYAGNAYDKYGVNSSEIIRKAEDYNLQKARLELSIAKEQKKILDSIEQDKKDAAISDAYSLLVKQKIGEDVSRDDLDNAAMNLVDLGYGKEANEFFKAYNPSSKSETAKQRAIENIGTRINNLSNLSGEERIAEENRIKEDIRKNRNLGYINDSLNETWLENLSGTGKKFDISYFTQKAKTEGLSKDDLDELDTAVANEFITATSKNAVIDINDRFKNISQYTNQIYQGEIYSEEQIDGLDITDKERVDLKKELKERRTSLGFDTPDTEKFYSLMNKGDYNKASSIYKTLPQSKKEKAVKYAQDIIKQKQNENYAKAYDLVWEGNLNRADINQLLGNKYITVEQANSLGEQLIKYKSDIISNSVSGVASDIINGKITTQEQLDKRFIDLPVSDSTDNNYKQLLSLLNEKNKPYEQILNSAFVIVDGSVKKDVFGSYNPKGLANAQQLKNVLLSAYNEILSSNNPNKLQILQQQFSTENILKLSQMFRVTFDEAFTYNIPKSYSAEEAVADWKQGNLGLLSEYAEETPAEPIDETPAEEDRTISSRIKEGLTDLKDTATKGWNWIKAQFGDNDLSRDVEKSMDNVDETGGLSTIRKEDLPKIDFSEA